jgi:hypothetical protein
MKYSYPSNSNSLRVTYCRTHDGPNHFIVFYKNLSTVAFTTKDVRKRLGSAKFTDSSKALSAWCDDMIAQYEKTSTDRDQDEVLATGFGPEAHLDQTDPNHQTRAVI